MEESEKLDRVLSSYSLKKSMEVSKQNVTDPHLFVHSNDITLLCPLMTNTPNAMYCGTHCAQFHVAAQLDEKKNPTGKVLGVQFCGKGRTMLFNNINIDFEKRVEDEKKSDGKEISMKKE